MPLELEIAKCHPAPTPVGRVDTALLLLAHGADAARRDREKRTPLECAPDARTRNALALAMQGA